MWDFLWYYRGQYYPLIFAPMAVDPNVIEFIKTARAQGKTREEITAELVSQGGWTHLDVVEAFASLPATMSIVDKPVVLPGAEMVTPQPVVEPAPQPVAQPAPVSAPEPVAPMPASVGKSKKPIGVIITIVGIAVLLIAGLVAYFFWPSKVETPVIIPVGDFPISN
jgi:hypothetical protein